MTNEEKALKVSGLKEVPDYEEKYYNPTGCRIYDTAMEMAKWKDEQLDKAIDKALEHHSNKLKEGKITQYGMDNVFAFVQNIRYILNSEL